MTTIEKSYQRMLTLEKQAASLRKAWQGEAAKTLPIIRKLIAFYGFSAADLLLEAAAPTKTDASEPAKKTRRTKRARASGAAKGGFKSAGGFKDPNSDAVWSGQGRRPAWFNAAIESGKTPDELRVQAA